MTSRAPPGRFDEPTLDQLLAEPIVQQMMHRDSTDEATIRRLLRETASARLASRAEDPETTESGCYRRIIAGSSVDPTFGL